MNCYSMQLYTKMQEELNELEMDCKNEMLMIEGCFNIAIFYWNKIKKYLESYLFKHENEEINFFKNIKPLFIAAIEYYTLYYQAMLFKPYNDKKELAAYWVQQLKRVEIFYNRHREFYNYYTSGQTCRDKMYFIRPGNANYPLHNVHLGTKATASHDNIAASILGYQKYRAYVETELQQLLLGNIKESFIQHGPATDAPGTTPHYNVISKQTIVIKKHFWVTQNTATVTIS